LVSDYKTLKIIKLQSGPQASDSNTLLSPNPWS